MGVEIIFVLESNGSIEYKNQHARKCSNVYIVCGKFDEVNSISSLKFLNEMKQHFKCTKLSLT